MGDFAEIISAWTAGQNIRNRKLLAPPEKADLSARQTVEMRERGSHVVIPVKT